MYWGRKIRFGYNEGSISVILRLQKKSVYQDLELLQFIHSNRDLYKKKKLQNQTFFLCFLNSYAIWAIIIYPNWAIGPNLLRFWWMVSWQPTSLAASTHFLLLEECWGQNRHCHQCALPAPEVATRHLRGYHRCPFSLSFSARNFVFRTRVN